MFDTAQKAGITTVLFDVGGVIVDWVPDFDLADQILGSTSSDREALTSTFTDHRDAYDEYLTGKEFWNTVASAVGRPELSPDQIEQLCHMDGVQWCTVKTDTIELIAELKAAGFSLGVLSNAPQYFADQCRASNWAHYFDVMTFSCEEKMIKPNPDLYRACLEKMGRSPSEVAFFDDRPDNVEAADSIGMRSWVFTTADRARTVMSSRFRSGE